MDICRKNNIAPKIDVFLFAPRLGPIRSVKALRTYHSLQHIGRCLPQLLDTQAATMDTPHGRHSSARATDTLLKHSTQHITLDDRMKSVEGLLTSTSSGFL